MSRYTLLKTVLLASGILLVSSVFAQTPGSNSPKTAAESPDAAFVQKAGHGGLAEVELSKLAVGSATSPQVKQFAEKMVQAHTENNQQLALIAAHENIALPKELDGEHAQLRDKLAAQHRADFDRSYVAAMRGDARRSSEDGRPAAIVTGDSQHRGVAHLHQADVADSAGSSAHGD